jgi:hypothetical protein
MRGLLRVAVAAFWMRSVGRRVEEGQPRRRFMGESCLEEGWDIVGYMVLYETVLYKRVVLVQSVVDDGMAWMGGRIGSS